MQRTAEWQAGEAARAAWALPSCRMAEQGRVWLVLLLVLVVEDVLGGEGDGQGVICHVVGQRRASAGHGRLRSRAGVENEGAGQVWIM